VPHQLISPAEIRSQRRFESLRWAAMYAAWRVGSTRESARVFVSDQTVTSASSRSISSHWIGEMYASCSSDPSRRRFSPSPESAMFV
jgi:hypothetical protein